MIGRSKAGEVVDPTARTASGFRWEVIENMPTDIEIPARAGGRSVVTFPISPESKGQYIIEIEHEFGARVLTPRHLWAPY